MTRVNSERNKEVSKEYNMESLAPTSQPKSPSIQQVNYSKYELDLTLLRGTFGADDASVNATGFETLPQALSLSAEEIISKLNELLAGKLPEGGIQGLAPEEVTPEATADRIVRQTTALFEAYKRQNQDKDPEEVLNNFMNAVRSGVEQGYAEAFEILEGLGAFKFDGVKAGVEQTKILIESKLQAFEKIKREELGISPTRLETQVTSEIASVSSASALTEAGARLNLVA
jgi:hypothetical protein